MTAFYNENDRYAAAWLRELINADLIAPGVVDERSIEDIEPDELSAFTQCHFFAGIGVWSYALRRAGWPDDRPAWTGSCPCQPFSAAGKGEGFTDERHLWPAWEYLIRIHRPTVVFGEQVASKDGLAWFDIVHTDLEGSNYAVGVTDLCAAGVGAPHIRQRTFFVAEALGDAAGARRETCVEAGGFPRRPDAAPEGGVTVRADDPVSGELGHTDSETRERRAGTIPRAQAEGEGAGRINGRQRHRHPDAGEARGLADPERDGKHRSECVGSRGRHESADGGAAHGLADADGNEQWEPGNERAERSSRYECRAEPAGRGSACDPGPTNGFWRNADWLGCRDGKFRPVEPGTFPLADGLAARVGRLRGYGNAINAEVARIFIETYLERA